MHAPGNVNHDRGRFRGDHVQRRRGRATLPSRGRGVERNRRTRTGGRRRPRRNVHPPAYVPNGSCTHDRKRRPRRSNTKKGGPGWVSQQLSSEIISETLWYTQSAAATYHMLGGGNASHPSVPQKHNRHQTCLPFFFSPPNAEVSFMVPNMMYATTAAHLAEGIFRHRRGLYLGRMRRKLLQPMHVISHTPGVETPPLARHLLLYWIGRKRPACCRMMLAQI